MQKASRALIVLILFLMMVPFIFPAAEGSGKVSGFYVLSADGTCLVYDAKGNVLFNGSGDKLEGKEIELGDSIETGQGAGLILIHYPDMSRVTLDEKSSFQLKDSRSVWLSLGKVWVKISHLFTQPADFQVESPNAVAVAHGTEFEVSQDPSGGPSSVHVFEGTVQVESGNLPPVALSQGNALSGIVKGTMPHSAPFDLTKIQNPWWKWNLDKEARLSLFFRAHRREIAKYLLQKGTPGERMRRIRGFMKLHGISRRALRRAYWRRSMPKEGGQSLRPGERFRGNQSRLERWRERMKERRRELQERNRKKRKTQKK